LIRHVYPAYDVDTHFSFYHRISSQTKFTYKTHLTSLMAVLLIYKMSHFTLHVYSFVLNSDLPKYIYSSLITTHFTCNRGFILPYLGKQFTLSPNLCSVQILNGRRQSPSNVRTADKVTWWMLIDHCVRSILGAPVQSAQLTRPSSVQ